MKIRRVVTGTDAQGKSYFMIDGEAGAVQHQLGRGLTFHEMWVTDGPLASNEGDEDTGSRPVVHHPPAGGTVFRVVELQPDEERTPEAVARDMDAIGAKRMMVRDSDPGMHRNSSVDYNVILEGEVYAKTDRGELLLGPGDCLIQRGTAHTWHNRSGRPCVYASIMVSAHPLRHEGSGAAGSSDGAGGATMT